MTDTASLERLYDRIGVVSEFVPGTRAYDTDDANRREPRVRLEFTARRDDP